RHGLLNNDGAMIELLVYKMHGAAGNLHTVRECLLLRFEPRKGRKQRRMDVQDFVWKLLHKPGREQSHVSGEADEIDFVLLQRGHNIAIMVLSLLAFRRNDQRLKSEAFGSFDPAGV